MELAYRVDTIARKIDKELDIEYLGYDEINTLGARYIDAADFVFAGRHESRLRIHVNGRDCSGCANTVELENLVRARIAAALSNQASVYCTDSLRWCEVRQQQPPSHPATRIPG